MRVRDLTMLGMLMGCAASTRAADKLITPVDERAIQAVLDEYVAAWNVHDIQRWSRIFTDDVDYVVITARHLKGRDETFAYHDDLHKGIFKSSELRARWKDLRLVSDRIAIGHVRFDARGDRGARGALGTAVLVKLRARWLIAAFQNTLLYGPPLPEQIPPADVLPFERK